MLSVQSHPGIVWVMMTWRREGVRLDSDLSDGLSSLHLAACRHCNLLELRVADHHFDPSQGGAALCGSDQNEIRLRVRKTGIGRVTWVKLAILDWRPLIIS